MAAETDAPTAEVTATGGAETGVAETVEANADGGPARGAEVADTGALILLCSVFVIAACGLGYELVAGTLSAYLLGNSATQFSLVIGLFLSAMGLGSFFSGYLHRDLLRIFLAVELAIGIIGGLAPLGLFAAFALAEIYRPFLFLSCIVVGALVGLEIPLLVRIVRAQTTLATALGRVLSVDYLGALAASLIFPLVLLPLFGLVRSGAFFGLCNIAVAAFGLYSFRRELGRRGWPLRIGAVLSAVLLIVVFFTAARTTTWLEESIYDDDIIYTETTPYQRIVLTRWRDDVRLFINGGIQFSSTDEYRYHEALVHPAMSAVLAPRRVLILGGGDGLVARQVLGYPEVEAVDLVDLDPAITRLFSEVPPLVELSDGALLDDRVRVINDDAYEFLQHAAGDTDAEWDVIIADLPDPGNVSVGKLYTRSFYRLVAKRLTPSGVFVTQASSPYFATDAFWCIVNTIAATERSSAGGSFATYPYQVSVPSLGDWGFVLASQRPVSVQGLRLRVPTRYLTADLMPTLFQFPKDVGPRSMPVNRLDDQVLVQLYRHGYGRFIR